MMRWLSAVALASTALAFVPIPSLATSIPPTVTAANVNVAENIGSGLAPFALVKTKGSSYSKVHVQTVDGSAKAGVDYRALDTIITLGNSAQTWSLPIAIIDNSTYQGTRSFTVRLTCTRYCSAQATPVTVTITDDETPPAPIPAFLPPYSSPVVLSDYLGNPTIIQECPDESLRYTSETCPVLVPNPLPVSATPWVQVPVGTVNRGLVRFGSALALTDCESFYNNIVQPLGAHPIRYSGVKAGVVYKVLSAWGSMYDYTVVTVVENPTGGQAITVSQSCLVGVS